MSAPQYPIRLLADVADIPDEALPRFYAELPAMIAQIKAIREAAPAVAADMREKAPRPWRWLPLGFWVAMVRGGGSWNPTWIDDDKGQITLSVAVSERDPFYSRTERL